MKKISTAILFLLVGAAAGGIAGLLLAPEKGEKTRKNLSKKVKKIKKSAEDTASEYMDKATNLKDNIADKANDLKNIFS